MEQLAERRMQREEDAQFAANRFASTQGHNQGPGFDEEADYDPEGDEEEYSDDDDDYEEDEMVIMIGGRLPFCC